MTATAPPPDKPSDVTLGETVRRSSSTSSIVFRLTRGGGPEPVLELRRVFEAAQEDPAGTTWIATRKSGSSFIRSPDSQLLAFAQERAGHALALTARIASRHETLPSDALVRDMYEEYKNSFRAYWKITNVHLRKVLVEELPGTTLAGKPIADAFRGQLSFAYWLPDSPEEQRAVETTGARDGERGRHRVPATQSAAAPGSSAVRGSIVPLHGVDFSGAQEASGRNGKIWIASWYPNRDFVELRSGAADPGFDRAGLASKIKEGSGTWVIDFPFGPPAEVAEAAGWNSWQEYLTWCGSDSDAKALRDRLRETLRRSGVRWSTPRNIDHVRSTTWFPFFEQLYRQTIAGARDVLRALEEAGRSKTRVLPFHGFRAASPESSVVIEGFPGWTLQQCGLPRTGYKHSGPDATDQRRRIINALRERGVPISDADASTAIHDNEGDAVDALVLVHAAQSASRRTATEWNDGIGPHAGIEGWFFD